MLNNKPFDIAVIGAGFAGLEAAFAVSRLGLTAGLFTLSADLVGNMACNPSIGGTGKGHLVFEIDALGGELGMAADAVMLQSRMLNLSKGPAVHSLRHQSDRRRFQDYMKSRVENHKNISLIQCEIIKISVEDGRVIGVENAFGIFYPANAVVIATGTSLRGRIIVGAHSYSSGPDNTLAANSLSGCLESLGVKMVRFKTGTPPRIHSDSIDYSKMERQEGDQPAVMFSSAKPKKNKRACYITYTNQSTKQILLDNLDKSPLYSGDIKGTGPRYCPSIEDKMMRFADKERHQIFIEPMGETTKEMYCQGLSSSMPEDIQLQVIRSVAGLENAQIMRTGYAIEYDCADPLQLKPTLEFREISGLYGAGQFNGSSGYEEAAAQGLMAGANAALKILNREPFTLARSESYIGTLIDDLVTKGTNEPYRIMTSRSEYRLLLRQDNTKSRLTEKAYNAGLVGISAFKRFKKDERLLAESIKRLEAELIKPSAELNNLLHEKGYEPLNCGIKKADLLRRPYININDIESLSADQPLPKSLLPRIETEIKYSGYIRRQLADVERFKKDESKSIPSDIDYGSIIGLRIEAAQKLEKLRPESIGRAGRISGVSPADISVLLVYLAEKYNKRQKNADK